MRSRLRARSHSDIARGFIRAETVAYDDLKAAGDMKGAKAHGKIRLEGKDLHRQGRGRHQLPVQRVGDGPSPLN